MAIPYFFQALATPHAATAMQSRVLRRLIARAIVPIVVVHVDTALLETVELEVGLVLGVKSRETIVASRTMEQHHVTQHALPP